MLPAEGCSCRTKMTHIYPLLFSCFVFFNLDIPSAVLRGSLIFCIYQPMEPHVAHSVISTVLVFKHLLSASSIRRDSQIIKTDRFLKEIKFYCAHEKSLVLWPQQKVHKRRKRFVKRDGSSVETSRSHVAVWPVWSGMDNISWFKRFLLGITFQGFSERASCTQNVLTGSFPDG